MAWAWGRRPAQAAWGGFWFGLGHMASGLWWLYISLHDFGGLAPPLSVLAVLLLSAYLALFPAAALGLWRACVGERPMWAVPVFGAAWLLAELARGRWFTGFPWLASGYAHTDSPLAALAPWIGVYGIGALAAMAAAAVAALGLALRARGRRGVADGGHPPSDPGSTSWKATSKATWTATWTAGWAGLAGVVLVVAAAHGVVREFTRPAGQLRVALLQTNVPQDLKFDPDRMMANLASLAAQLHAAQADLVVTPESVVPLPRHQLDPAFWDHLVGPFQAPGAPRAALIGLFVGDEQVGYSNALVGVDGHDTAHYVYGKRHLLPFGEYVPPGFRWFVDLLAIPLGDQVAGRQTRPWAVAGQRVRPMICYEDLFGEDIAPSVVGPEAATLLVNATNLAWFGPHMVQDQHLQFSRMRALEFQRAVARATNTGATAIVDHQGTVVERTAPLQRLTLVGTVQGRVGDTPYARWLAAWGLLPLWALALAVLGAAALSGGRRRPGG